MIEFKEAIYSLDRKNIKKFLAEYELDLEEDIEYTVIAVDDDEIIATGSLSGNVLKCFAVNDNYRGLGITNTIISMLIQYEHSIGNEHIFIFTKPKNKKIFTSLGFTAIAEVEDVVLLDSDVNILKKELSILKSDKESGVIVMNANPLTLGHLKLIKKASEEVELLNIIMVLEDKSVFPFEDRYEIVKNEISNLDNVVLHKGNEYIISKSTFPTYFYKDKGIVVKSYSDLDLRIFGEYFVKTLNIKKRFVGTEEFDIVTEVYNEEMKKILPQYGVDVVEIKRFDVGGDIISASKVRKLLKDGKYEEAYKYLPQSTINYLKSDKGLKVIEKL